MHLVFFTHPFFLGSQSMPRFTHMLADGMRKRGHTVEIWSPVPRFFTIPLPSITKKWLGYVDQYIVFPVEVRKRLRKVPSDTLFVFTDHALGPWVPLIADRPHVIHCHDFLAQRSALGEIPENPTGWSGKRYQQFIRRGYRAGKHFISVSKKTREDLHRFLLSSPCTSEIVYNGLNQSFAPMELLEARTVLGKAIQMDIRSGYLLHVGGNQWYKNRVGVIEIYNAWRSMSNIHLPLLMIGPAPSSSLVKTYTHSSYKADIHFLSGLEDILVRLAYAGASVFLFPSLTEGFGWPIAEAMAAGCPVITTNEAPMTEVAGDAAFLIARFPGSTHQVASWAIEAAQTVEKVITLSSEARKAVVEAGLVNAKRFDTDKTLDTIEKIYRRVLAQSLSLTENAAC